MEISEKINRIKEIIVENYHPDKIILFGSCARRDADEQSDIDIFVISDREKDLPRYRRGLDVRIKLSEVETPKDILFYTHADIGRWVGVKHTYVNEVLKEGEVLYER
jgi:predicted nucleotidyltransferase